MNHPKPLIGKARDVLPLANRRLNIWEGSVRSSKTVGSLMAWTAFVTGGPPGNLLMVGKTERTLKRNILDVLISWLGPGRTKLVAGSGEFYLCGRRIYIAGANDERAQEKIRGMSLVGAYVDEMTLIPESMATMLLSRLSDPGARLYATTNPDSPAHWLMRDHLSRPALHVTGSGDVLRSEGDQVLDLARFTFTLDDNPYLDPVFVANLKREYVGLWYKRFIEGLWVVAEGAIYESWDPERHVVNVLPAISRWYGVGVDYGTTAPFVALVLGLGAEDKRLYLTHEWRWDSRMQRRSLTDEEYSRELRQFLADAPIPASDGMTGIAPEWTVVDPSATSFRVQLQRDGITARLADNEVLDGIRMMASLIAGDRFRVSSTCKGWIEEAPGYVWDPDQSKKGIDAPVKLNDHDMDCGRYVVRTTRALWRPEIRPAGSREPARAA